MATIKITIELEPEIAMLMGTYLHQTVQGNMDWHNMLTPDGTHTLMEIGQDIINQLSEQLPLT